MTAAVTGDAGPVAAIDCGSNSTRLLVVGPDGATWRRLMRITRLGQGVDASGALTGPAMARTLGVLAEYRAVLDQLGVERVRLVATSAVRDAANRDDLLDQAGAVVGVPAELLTGDEEGRLSFAGATAGLDPEQGPYLVVDIGGGSTEVVVGGEGPDRRQPVGTLSLDVGCVRVSERYLAHDPPTPAELAAADAGVRAQLDQVRGSLPGVGAARVLVGLAGTVSTLAAMAAGLDAYDRDRLHHTVLSRAQVDELLAGLAGEDREARLVRPGLEEARADVIVGGAVVLAAVMDHLGFDTCLVSESDLLDGLVASLLATRPAPPSVPVLGLVGNFDGRSVSHHLAARVVRDKLAVLGQVEVVALAPEPGAGPLDAGHPVEALGPWTEEGRAQLAARFDAWAVLEGSEPHLLEGLGSQHQAGAPTLRLDPAALAGLAPEVLDAGAQERRLAWLRLVGWHPPGGRTVAVVTEGLDAAAAAPLVDALRAVLVGRLDLGVVVLGPGGAELGEAVRSALAERTAVLTGPLSLEDVAAVQAAASVVVAGSAPAAALARAYGRPVVVLGEGELGEALEEALSPVSRPASRAGPASRPAAAGAGLDRLARVLGLVDGPARPRPDRVGLGADGLGADGLGVDGLGVDRAGFDRAGADRVRDRRRRALRLVMAERLAALGSDRADLEARLAKLRDEASAGYARHQAEVSALRAELAVATSAAAEVATLRAALNGALAGQDRLEWELEATRATRLFRWASGPRRVYGRIRRWR